MGQDIGAVRHAFEQAEKVGATGQEQVSKVENEPPFDPSHRGGGAAPSNDGPDLIDNGGAGSARLPASFPVQPLGMAAGKFHFLTARGEKMELTAGAMNNRANLVALVVGAADAVDHLAAIAPPENRRDNGFNVAVAADKLMLACSDLPLFDDAMQIRHCGTWRGANGHPIVHLGEQLITAPDEPRVGRMINKALYPAVPARPAPSNENCSQADLEWVRDRLQKFWNWEEETDANVLLGFVGQAVLGQYPEWRAHCWIKGKHGSGKSAVLDILSALMGGMSIGVKNSTSAAAMRQTTNRMAVGRIFDEAEKTGNGAVEEVIALFRLMSGSAGAQVERGTSDHSGVRFELYGAGLLASIIPGRMDPQDQSRFVMLTLNERNSDLDPADQALLLEELEADAKRLGAGVWARMLSLAPVRWDRTFRVYNGIVQGLGVDARTGDTIGAVLAGWDLMLFDEPLVCPASGEPQRDRIELAKTIAQPLIAMTQEAEEESEGERFLRTLFSTYISKDHGGAVTVAELIESLQDSHELDYNNKLLGRLGVRVLDGERGSRELFVINGHNSLLDRAMGGTRWRGGGHTGALDTMSEVRKSPQAIRVAGRPMRGRIIPARFLPGFKAKAPDGGHFDHAV
ncbi:MAG: hypothetical protein ACRBB0_27110 [Pelagimonas sp.]|uniref:hypothetical protein n=1 Tax=Pelagimonas sp. TaxID=2073170 RepID=UPI003D6AD9F3